MREWCSAVGVVFLVLMAVAMVTAEGGNPLAKTCSLASNERYSRVELERYHCCNIGLTNTLHACTFYIVSLCDRVPPGIIAAH